MKLVNLVKMKEISCFSQKELSATDDFQEFDDLLIPHFGWLRQLKFENIAEVTLCQLGLSLQSVFAPVFQYITETFLKCGRFPHEEKTIFEWFDLPRDTRSRNQIVKEINIEKEARKSWERDSLFNEVKLNELHLLDELHEFEMFFHGTSHRNAEAIIDGIDLKQGGERLQFSHGDGFYVYNNLFDARHWAVSHFSERRSAVLVFRVRKNELRGDNNDNGLDLTGVDKKKEWQELITTFRGPESSLSKIKRKRKELRDYDFIEGPEATSEREANEKFPTPRDGNSYQLCVRSKRCVELFNTSLCAVIYFNVAR